MISLSTLHRSKLAPEHEAVLRELDAQSLGPAVWRARKHAEAHELFALSQIADRLTVVALDLRTELRALLALRGPVPTLPPGANEVVVADSARLVVRYPEELLTEPLPGYALVQILLPRHVWLPNASYDPAQRLCLGANIPRNFPLREIVLQTYAALGLQAISLDRMDPAGVMNREAVAFWNARTDAIPLTTEPFLGSAGGAS